MDCPKCGALIPEGKLYCPQCGYAIQIVPDYDTDLQDNLESVGSDIAGTVNRIDLAENSKPEYDIDATTKEMEPVSKEEALNIKRKNEQEKRRTEMIVTWTVALGLLVVVIVVAVFASSRLAGSSFIPGEAIDNVASTSEFSIDTISQNFENDESDDLLDDEMNAAGEEALDESLSDNAISKTVKVSPESGTYNEPYNISAAIEGNTEQDDSNTIFEGIIYYTTDGSEPDETSKVYKHELPMPVGESHFAFRVMDDTGSFSETVKADYVLNYQSACSPVDAANLCIAKLIQDGALLDIYGHVAGSSGVYTYKCDTMVRAGNSIYYLVPEYYTEVGGRETPTGTVYAVDTASLVVYRAKTGADGTYTFEVFY